MYRSRRLKKLWGNKPASLLLPQENQDTALAEGFGSHSAPDPNYPARAIEQPSASDDDEVSPLSSRRSSSSRSTKNLGSNTTFPTDLDTAQNDSNTRPLNLDLTKYATHDVVIPKTHVRTDMSNSLGGSDCYLRNHSHVQFSEDVADRNVQMSKTSGFPDPTSPVLAERFNEDVVDRNMDRIQADDPLSTSTTTAEVNQTRSASPYAMVELHDRKFSQPSDGELSDDPYRRVGRKPTGYVKPEDFDEMDTKAARRKSLVLAGRSLQEGAELDISDTEDLDDLESKDARRRSLIAAGKAVYDSDSESLLTSVDASLHPEVLENENQTPVVERAKPNSTTTRALARTATSSEDSEQSLDGGPSVLLPYTETQDSHSSEDSLHTRLRKSGYGVEAKQSSVGSKESIDGGPRILLPYAEATISTPSSVENFNQGSDSSSQASQMISPRTPPDPAEEATDNYLIKESENPIDLSSVVDVSNTIDTEVNVKYAPAVTHETVHPEVHHIREELITREYHNHDEYHRILPIYDVEILPPRHFIHGADGKLVEVPESTIPDSSKNFYPLSRVSTEPEPAPEKVTPPVKGWRRPFTARFWRGTEGDAKETVGEDGIHRTETTWVHPPTLEEGGKLTGQTEPFYFDEPDEKVLDLGGLVETSDRMPGGWDGANELPIRTSSVTSRFNNPQKPVGTC